MRRRALLRAAALAGVAGIAGCTTDGPSDGGDGGGGGSGGGSSPTDSPTGSPTDTPAPESTDTLSETPSDDATHSPSDSPTDEPTATRTPQGNGMIGEEFEVTSQQCGEGRNTVDIAWDGQAVTLDGVIDGSDACYTAEQESVDYDPATDRLRVNVRAYRPDEDRACADCLVDIEYEARYVFEGDTPDEVTVAHDGHDIASAGAGSSTPSSN